MAYYDYVTSTPYSKNLVLLGKKKSRMILFYKIDNCLVKILSHEERAKKLAFLKIFSCPEKESKVKEQPH
jgi:hypothetical protein